VDTSDGHLVLIFLFQFSQLRKYIYTVNSAVGPEIQNDEAATKSCMVSGFSVFSQSKWVEKSSASFLSSSILELIWKSPITGICRYEAQDIREGLSTSQALL